LYRVRHLVNRLNEGRASVPAMTRETATLLSARFAQPNAALAELLGRSLTAWGE
jgi:hypothetical protein